MFKIGDRVIDKGLGVTGTVIKIKSSADTNYPVIVEYDTPTANQSGDTYKLDGRRIDSGHIVLEVITEPIPNFKTEVIPKYGVLVTCNGITIYHPINQNHPPFQINTKGTLQ